MTIFIILAVALFLRVININQSLWLDEATSVLVARDFSFSQILTSFSPGDFHPPLYYLMLKIWVSLFGSGEVAARAMSVLFGVGTVYIIYLIGKKLFDKKIGLFSALLLATAPLHIYYSQEARMYVPATFFVALAVLFFLKRHWLGFILASTLLIYTDYLPGFLFLALAFTKHPKKWLGSIIVVALLFLPWIPTLLQQLQQGLLVKTAAPEWWKVLGRTNFKQLALVPLKFSIGRIPVEPTAGYVAALSLPGFIFGSLFLRGLKLFKETKFLWLWLLVPTISAALLGLRLSVFSYFRFLFVLPAFYLILSSATLSLKNKNIRALAIVMVLLINLTSSSLYLFNPNFHREDWRGAVRFIEQNSVENTATLFVSRGQQEAYDYYSTSVPSFGPEAVKLSFSKIWLMRYVQPIFDPEDKLREEVESRGYQKVAEHDFNGVVIWEYQ